MTYPGGKNAAGVYQAIGRQMPPHQVRIEPFLGSGAMTRLIRPAALNVGIDRSEGVIEGFRHWAPSPGSPRTAAIASSGDSAGYRAVSGDAYWRATSKAAILDPATPGAAREYSVRIHSSIRALAAALRCRSAEVDEGRSTFHFATGCGMEFLEQHRFRGDELVYCDPPYVRSSRRLTRDQYRYEMTDVDHRRLLRVLRNLSCMVILSGYWSRLYGAQLQEWRHVTFTGVTRGGPATEWLWCNFPEPVELHDTRYAGENWRERDRINKKIRRALGKLAKMPSLERQAYLSAIARIYDSGERRSRNAESVEGTRLAARPLSKQECAP